MIQYRLRKEILNNLSKTEEENLLAQIYQTPYFKLVESYVKPNGYVGIGMHSGSGNIRETPLHDGEPAARLLSYYAVPKLYPIVTNFVAAMRNDEILRHEFSYSSTAVRFFEDRFLGMNSRFCLDVLLYAMGSLKMLERCGYIPYPIGNVPEKHYITGEDIVQMDFVYSPIAIRLAVPADAPNMAEVHIRSWEVAYKNIIPAEYISQKNATRHALYARVITDDIQTPISSSMPEKPLG